MSTAALKNGTGAVSGSAGDYGAHPGPRKMSLLGMTDGRPLKPLRVVRDPRPGNTAREPSGCAGRLASGAAGGRRENVARLVGQLSGKRPEDLWSIQQPLLSLEGFYL